MASNYFQAGKKSCLVRPKANCSSQWRSYRLFSSLHQIYILPKQIAPQFENILGLSVGNLTWPFLGSGCVCPAGAKASSVSLKQAKKLHRSHNTRKEYFYDYFLIKCSLFKTKNAKCVRASRLNLLWELWKSTMNLQISNMCIFSREAEAESAAEMQTRLTINQSLQNENRSGGTIL